MNYYNFEIGNGKVFDFYCKSRNTRSGFAHDCFIYAPGYDFKVSCFYYNRTWESYGYQTVLHKALEYIVCRELHTSNRTKKFAAAYKQLRDRFEAWRCGDDSVPVLDFTAGGAVKAA